MITLVAITGTQVIVATFATAGTVIVGTHSRATMKTKSLLKILL
jgi:hypothetical protein